MSFAELYNDSEYGKKYPESKFYNKRAIIISTNHRIRLTTIFQKV